MVLERTYSPGGFEVGRSLFASVVSRPAGLYRHSDPPCTATAASRGSKTKDDKRSTEQSGWVRTQKNQSVREF